MLTILIPTKDRPTLAMRAVKSVLNQKECGKTITLVVSDNSEIKENREILEKYCIDENILYHATPKVLSMTAHWDWAFEKVIGLNEYITILTDRMAYKNNIFSEIFQLLRKSDAKIITYPNDSIGSVSLIFGRLYFPSLQTTSGKIKKYSSDFLVKCASECILPMSLPRMLNSIVCTDLVKNKKIKFGKFFDSISPDFNMCWSLLSMEEEIFYLDKSILISGGLQFSNGKTFGRNKSFAANSFKKLSMTEAGLFHTPFPNVITGVNGPLHEYEAIKKIVNNYPEPDYYQWYGRTFSSLDRAVISEYISDIDKIFETSDLVWLDNISSPEVSKSLFKKIMKFKKYFLAKKIFLSEDKAIEEISNTYSFGPHLDKRSNF